ACTRSARGELDGVAQEIDEHLPDLAGVPRHRARQRRIQLESKLEAFLPGQLPEHQLHLVQQRMQVERLERQRGAARLDLRHFQDVVDQYQEMIAAGVNDVDLL